MQKSRQHPKGGKKNHFGRDCRKHGWREGKTPTAVGAHLWEARSPPVFSWWVVHLSPAMSGRIQLVNDLLSGVDQGLTIFRR
jgi:hypothetical protein